MATRRYGISPGESFRAVDEAVGAATVANDIELTVNLATVTSKEQVILALTKFKDYLQQNPFPPV
jgi:hypothetical protein